MKMSNSIGVERQQITGTSVTSWLPYALATFVCSFLIFLVQPMLAKAVTPAFGGTSSVWTSAMMVGQVLLLVGYVWAQRLGSRISRQTLENRRGVAIATIIVTGIVVTITALAPIYVLDTSATASMWHVLGLTQAPAPELAVPVTMIATVGFAMALLCAQAPLIQSAYARANPNANPYPLYSASNAGSLLGLLAYPFLLEPILGVGIQLGIWKWAAIISLIATALVVIISALKKQDMLSVSLELMNGDVFQTKSATGTDIRTWLFLSMTATVIMMSAGQMVTNDIMSMPLVWVLPLGAYLVGYITAFSIEESRILRKATMGGQAAVLVLATLAATASRTTGAVIAVLSILAIVVLTHKLMRQAYDSRPMPAELGRFYLTLALGGVAGGLVSAIVAPLMFDWRWELPIALLGAAWLLTPTYRKDEHSRIMLWLRAVAVIIGVLGIGIQVFGSAWDVPVGIAIIMLGACLTVTHAKRLFTLGVVGLMVCTGLVTHLSNSIQDNAHRSYYGIMTVSEKTLGGIASRSLLHGSTLHGIQLLDAPTRLASYYSISSGVQDVMRWKAEQRSGQLHATVIGLGAGTLSCLLPDRYATRFFEIDPEVVDIARTRFEYLERCAPRAVIRAEDGRKGLELQARKAGASQDIVVLDAFSSDAIPLHLLTTQALDIAMANLDNSGVLAIHVSNRFLEVNRPVTAWAQMRGYEILRKQDEIGANNVDLATSSDWIAVRRRVRNTDMSSWAKEMPIGWFSPARESLEPWTDDKSSIVPILKNDSH